MAENESDQPGKTDSRPAAEGDQRTGPLDDKEKKEDSNENPEWKNLSSSNLSQYKYDKENQQLAIIFHGGRQYSFRGVDQDTADGLGTTSSPGSYFHRKIKGKFSYG
jgi:hypothetical protein